MKIFIYDITSYIGKAVIDVFKDEETKFYGTYVPGSPKPKTKKNIYPIDDDVALREILNKCELVVCHLFGNLNDVHKILRECRKKPEESTFVAISTIITWKGNEYTKEKLLLEENYPLRLPSEYDLPIKTLENIILESSNSRLSSYVLACGVFYGKGEKYFDLMFKEAWLCLQEGVGVPCYHGSRALNTLPTIHITDVAKIIQSCHTGKPDKHYIVAIDKGKYTTREIVSSISKKLGINITRDWNEDEAITNLDVYRNIGAFMQINLDFDRETLAVSNEVSIEWTSENGIIYHLPRVIKEFIKEHTLFPQRIILLGPPSSGKSHYAKVLSTKYYLPIVTASIAIEYAKSDPKLNKLMVRELSRKSNKTKRLSPPLLALIIKTYLLTPECRNKGYILDGFPRTYFEADCLFRKDGPDLTAKEEIEEDKENEGEGIEDVPQSAGDNANKDEEQEEGKEEDEEKDIDLNDEQKENEEGDGEDDGPKEEPEPEDENEEDLTPEVDKKIIPSSVIILEASEELLTKRIMNLPQSEIIPGHNDEEGFKRRYNLYLKNHNPSRNNTTFTYFEVNCKLEVMPLKSSLTVEEALPNLSIYIEKKKAPSNYHPTKEELEKMKEEKARMNEEINKRRELELKLAREKEAKDTEEQENIHKNRLDRIMDQEDSLETIRNQSTREYLMNNIIPTLTEGLLSVVQIKPTNEYDYLAEYLFNKLENSK